MFESIKGAMTKSTQQSSLSNILRTKPGNTYVVRLIPCVTDPVKTFFHHYSHGWVSEITGQYQSAISPQTWGERDPIAEARYRISRTGTEEEKEKARALNRKENWLVNVYVVKDPDNPENEGKIKIFKFGRQIHKIVMEAMEGEDADEFGEKIFDLSKNGCNFRIKVEEQGGYATYVSSRFSSPSEILGVTDEKIKEIHDQIHDLENVYPVKSYDELEVMLKEHYYGKTDEPAAPEETSTSVTVEDDDLNFDDLLDDSKAKDSNSDSSIDDDKVKELLDTLD